MPALPVQDLFNAPRANGFDPFIYAFESADLDGDGFEDLLTYFITQFGPDDVTTWRNVDGRTFESWETINLAPVFAGTIQPQNSELGDFDGDGDIDLANVFQKFIKPGVGEPTLRVFVNNGSGQFPAYGDFPVNAIGQAVPGDREGDGKTDIAFLSTTASWLTYDGSAFVEGPVLALPPGLFLSRPVLADLNADGLLDVVTETGPTYDSMQVLISDPVGPMVRTEIPLPAATFGNINMVHVVGDIDGDGDEDILVARRAAGSAEQELVLLPLLQDATGTFVEAPPQVFEQVTFGEFIDLTYPSLVDWDLDGDLDLVDRPRLLFVNDGAGNFSSPLRVNFELGGDPPAPTDVDGDGYVDLIGSSAVYFGDGTLEGLTRGIETEFEFPVLPDRLQSVDADGDGDVDLLERDAARVASNDANGNYADFVDILPSAPGDDYWSSPIGFGDFDGDGLDDFIVDRLTPATGGAGSSLGLQLLRGASYGLYEDAGPAAPSKLEVDLPSGQVGLAFDANGDGANDLAISGGYHISVGSPQLLGLIPTGWGEPVLTFDQDGDGVVELLTRENSKYVLHDVVAGSIVSVDYIDRADAGDVFRELDLDDDGDLDLVLFSDFDESFPEVEVDQIYIAENTGAGYSFSQLITLSSTGGFGFQGRSIDLTAGDVDADGQTDLVVLRDPDSNGLVGNRIEWFSRPGSELVFELRATWFAGGTSRLADVDTDGDIDAFGGNSFSSIRLEGLANDGASVGYIRQYGTGVAGSGGIEPIIGTTGPLSAGTAGELRIVRGLGGAPALWGIGTSEAELPLAGFPGVTLLIDNFILLQSVALDGVPGRPGDGSFIFPFTVVGPLVGANWFEQAVIFDAGAPALLSQTNGLEKQFGQ